MLAAQKAGWFGSWLIAVSQILFFLSLWKILPEQGPLQTWEGTVVPY